MTQHHVLLLLAMLLMAGCGSSRPAFVAPGIPSEFPNHSAAGIIDAVSEVSRSFQELETKSRMRYETPSESRSVNLDISYRRADTLLVKAKVTLGIEAMRSLVTPDSFFVYDRLNRRLYHGPVEQAYRLLPTPGPLDEMFESIAGVVEVENRIDWQVSHDSLYYYLSTADRARTFTVDPRLWRVVRSEEKTPSGDLVERRTFTDFDLFGQHVVPRRIDVERPMARERFQVYHRSVHVNPERLSFHFQVGRIDENILVTDKK